MVYLFLGMMWIHELGQKSFHRKLILKIGNDPLYLWQFLNWNSAVNKNSARIIQLVMADNNFSSSSTTFSQYYRNCQSFHLNFRNIRLHQINLDSLTNPSLYDSKFHLFLQIIWINCLNPQSLNLARNFKVMSHEYLNTFDVFN